MAYILVLLLPFAAVAQDTGGDVGFIARKLQEALSGAGREVTIRGFRGALSSRATLEELTIADADGVWLTLRNAAFDWNPAALLKQRLQVNELSAGALIINRLPKADTGAKLPSSTAVGFSLPELPVSVLIGKLAIDRADLGAALLGEQVVAKLGGGLTLAGGEGNVDLSLTRIDGRVALVRLKGSYANDSQILDLDLRLTEAENGLVVNLLDLPGAPSLDLGVLGHGPLDGFTAALFLATDGVDRLTGEVTLKSTVTSAEGAQPVLRDWQFQAEADGDLAAVFKPDYKTFFGRSLHISTAGTLSADGRIVLRDMKLEGAAAEFHGELALAADGWPEHIDITGHIAPPGDRRTARLPLPGPETDLERLDLTVAYDAAVDNSWSARLWIEGLERGEDRLGALSVLGQGQISRNGDSDSPGSVTANLLITGAEIGIGNEGVDALLAEGLAAALDLSWSVGQAIDISSFKATSGGITLSGAAQISDLAAGGRLSGDVLAQVQDLGQAAVLAGRPLAGQLTVRVSGQADVLGGGFDATFAGRSTDVDVGIAELAPYLAGESTLNLAARRDAVGTDLTLFELESALVAVSATAMVTPQVGDLTFELDLKDISQLAPELRGAVSLSGTAQKLAQSWTVDLNATSGAGFNGTARGTLAADLSEVDIETRGAIPLALVSKFVAPRTITGILSYDLQVQGPLALASVSGTLRTQNARFSAPKVRLALSDIEGEVTIAGPLASVRLRSAVSPEGQVAATGSLGLVAPYPANMSLDITSVRLSDPALYDTVVDGQISLIGPAAGGAMIAGSLVLGKVDVRIPSVIGGSIGNVPGLVHSGETGAIYATRVRAGFVVAQKTGAGRPPSYPIDLQVTAGQGIFIRGRGLDVELGGDIRLLGATDNLIPEGEFDLVRGRLDFLARRLELNSAQIALEGGFVPTVHIEAGSKVDDTEVLVIVDGPLNDPVIEFTSQPKLPEDETLALLLFGSSVTSLSPLQAAELASAVAKLAGRSGFSLITKLREGFGLDNLNIDTDEEGNTIVRAGKYLSQNIFTDVAVNSDGESEINLNLDISDSITVMGSVSASGNSSIGVFFEKEY